MFKVFVCCALFTAVLAGVIHEEYEAAAEYSQEPIASETDHHHKIDHEHAQSHQSVSIHHYHPVPVYVKKEDQQFLKHPVEIGGTKQKLKVLHPKTEHSHGYGLALEEHSETKFHHIGHPHEIEEHHPQVEEYHGYE